MASLEEPPPYEGTASQPEPRTQNDDGPLSLILDGELIYPAEPPARALYELSHPPCLQRNKFTKVCGVQKVRWRRAVANGVMQSRLDHIYDFGPKGIVSIRDTVEIKGKSSSKRTYKETLVSPGIGGWSTCSAHEHFKAAKSVSTRLKGERRTTWKDEKGNLVAEELTAKREKDGKLVGMPQLDLKATLGEKDLDLLVTCWTVRLWKESEKALAEGLSWDKFKRVTNPTSTHVNFDPLAKKEGKGLLGFMGLS